MADWFKTNVTKTIGDLSSNSDVIFADNIQKAVEQLLWRIDSEWSNKEEIKALIKSVEEKPYSYFKFDYKGEEIKAFVEHTKEPLKK